MSKIKVPYTDENYEIKFKSIEKCSEAIRRIYLLGQKKEVLIYIVLELCEELLRQKQVIKLLKEQLEDKNGN
jgi:hypothetical protein